MVLLLILAWRRSVVVLVLTLVLIVVVTVVLIVVLTTGFNFGYNFGYNFGSDSHFVFFFTLFIFTKLNTPRRGLHGSLKESL